MNDENKSKKRLKKEGRKDNKKQEISEEQPIYRHGVSQLNVKDHLKILDFENDYIDLERSLGLQKVGHDNESWRKI